MGIISEGGFWWLFKHGRVQVHSCSGLINTDGAVRLATGYDSLRVGYELQVAIEVQTAHVAAPLFVHTYRPTTEARYRKTT
jgi:hypothetical protein